jgi:hypothetical protein
LLVNGHQKLTHLGHQKLGSSTKAGVVYPLREGRLAVAT